MVFFFFSFAFSVSFLYYIFQIISEILPVCECMCVSVCMCMCVCVRVRTLFFLQKRSCFDCVVVLLCFIMGYLLQFGETAVK